MNNVNRVFKNKYAEYVWLYIKYKYFTYKLIDDIMYI